MQHPRDIGQRSVAPDDDECVQCFRRELLGEKLRARFARVGRPIEHAHGGHCPAQRVCAHFAGADQDLARSQRAQRLMRDT